MPKDILQKLREMCSDEEVSIDKVIRFEYDYYKKCESQLPSAKADGLNREVRRKS